MSASQVDGWEQQRRALAAQVAEWEDSGFEREREYAAKCREDEQRIREQEQVVANMQLEREEMESAEAEAWDDVGQAVREELRDEFARLHQQEEDLEQRLDTVRTMRRSLQGQVANRLAEWPEIARAALYQMGPPEEPHLAETLLEGLLAWLQQLARLQPGLELSEALRLPDSNQSIADLLFWIAT